MARPSNEKDTCSKVPETLYRDQGLAAADHFAATVMHEINNPLEAMANLAYLVHEDAEQPGKVRQYIRLLEEQLALVRGIAQQTLGFYRLPLKPIDMVGVAEAAIRMHERKISTKELRLLKTLPADALVMAHAGEMLQVISNLVGNALDALPPNGALSIRIRRCETEVHVTVADNGHGIPDTILAQIFEPFFTTKQEQGTGLGLSISKSIIERHNGRTRSSVRPDRNGTTFRISLPRHRTAQA